MTQHADVVEATAIRAGEAAIVREAALLRAKAVERLAELAHRPTIGAANG